MIKTEPLYSVEGFMGKTSKNVITFSWFSTLKTGIALIPKG